MPIGPLGKLGSLVLGAKLTLEEETHRIRPSYHVGPHLVSPLVPLRGNTTACGTAMLVAQQLLAGQLLALKFR